MNINELIVYIDVLSFWLQNTYVTGVVTLIVKKKILNAIPAMLYIR
jgi:hypothetical protein